MQRLATKVVLAVFAMLLPLVVAAGPAHAAGAPEQFLERMNQLRSSKGLGPLTMDGPLTTFAQGWTDHMAETGKLAHNPQLASAPGSWSKLGENVGVGAQVDTLFDAFVASPHHYANLVDPAFALVGIAVVVTGNGTMWTTHNFMAKAAAPKVTTTTAPRPTTTTTVAPRPAPAPAAATSTTVARARAAAAATAAPAPPVAPAAVAPVRIRLSLEQSRGAHPVL